MGRIGGRRLKERGKPCPYCRQPMRATGAHEATPDHMVAHSKGGRAGQNILYVCRKCNLDKAELSLSEFLTKLERDGDKRAKTVRQFIESAAAKIHIDFDPTK